MIEMFLYTLFVVVAFIFAMVSCLLWVVTKTDKLKDNTFEGDESE